MSFLHDSFWQFIITTVIAIVGIVIPLMKSSSDNSPYPGSSGGPSRRWVAPMVIVSIFLIVLVLFYGFFFVTVANIITSFSTHVPNMLSSNPGFSNLTSGTPDETLNTYCSDIMSGAYQQAYDEYSTDLKNKVTSSQFVQTWSDQKLDACTHDPIEITSNTASTTLSTHGFFTKATVNYKVILVQDGNNGWRINSIE